MSSAEIIKSSIEAVIEKRQSRGTTVIDLLSWLRHIHSDVWKNDIDIKKYIEEKIKLLEGGLHG